MADIIIETVIPSAVVDKFRLGFLRVKPITLDGEGEPIYTEKQWISECIDKYLTRQYRRGKKLVGDDDDGDNPIFG